MDPFYNQNWFSLLNGIKALRLAGCKLLFSTTFLQSEPICNIFVTDPDLPSAMQMRP